MNDGLARRNWRAEDRRREAAADAEDDVGPLQELAGHRGAGIAAAAQRERMVFPKGALAGQRCHDRRLNQLGKFAQLVARLGPQNALANV